MKIHNFGNRIKDSVNTVAATTPLLSKISSVLYLCLKLGYIINAMLVSPGLNSNLRSSLFSLIILLSLSFFCLSFSYPLKPFAFQHLLHFRCFFIPKLDSLKIIVLAMHYFIIHNLSPKTIINAHSHTIRVTVHPKCAPNYIKNLHLSTPRNLNSCLPSSKIITFQPFKKWFQKQL